MGDRHFKTRSGHAVYLVSVPIPEGVTSPELEAMVLKRLTSPPPGHPLDGVDKSEIRIRRWLSPEQMKRGEKS